WSGSPNCAARISGPLPHFHDSELLVLGTFFLTTSGDLSGAGVGVQPASGAGPHATCTIEYSSSHSSPMPSPSPSSCSGFGVVGQLSSSSGTPSSSRSCVSKPTVTRSLRHSVPEGQSPFVRHVAGDARVQRPERPLQNVPAAQSAFVVHAAA